MHESSYGLIVEGSYDESVFAEFVGKILSREPRVFPRPCGGITQLMRRFPGFLRELEHAWAGRPVDKALVIRDWCDADLAAGEQRMSQIVEGRQFAFPRGVKFCCVRQEMEAWLLADENAINCVARQRGGRPVPPVQGQVEEIRNPKETLRRLLSEAELPYDAEVCREIAHRADIEVLRYRCPSFRSFENKVIDC